MNNAAAEVGPPRAGPPPLPDATAEFMRATTIDAIVFLAGKAGERRSRAGVTPGWRMHRTREELIAFHEAAHAAVAHLLGNHVHRLSIIKDETIKIDKRLVQGGYCQHTSSAETPAPPARNTSVRGDLYRAAQCCKIIALAAQEPYNWRLVMQTARHLRARAESLIECAWRPLIIPLATELAKRGELDKEAITQFLSDDTRGIADP